jgi:hypothetical protein
MKEDLTRAANQLLRKLNREVFQDSIDITKLGIGVGLVEDFADHVLAAYREQQLKPGGPIEDLVWKILNAPDQDDVRGYLMEAAQWGVALGREESRVRDEAVGATEVNFVADAISEYQYCSSCAGTKVTDVHCKACTEEAKVAIKAIDTYRSTLGSGGVEGAAKIVDGLVKDWEKTMEAANTLNWRMQCSAIVDALGSAAKSIRGSGGVEENLHMFAQGVARRYFSVDDTNFAKCVGAILMALWSQAGVEGQKDGGISEKLSSAMNLLGRINLEEPPDEDWCRDYFLLTGDHMVRTDGGWQPPFESESEYEIEILEEVNAGGNEGERK